MNRHYFLLFGWVCLIAKWTLELPDVVELTLSVTSLICSIIFLTMYYLQTQREKYDVGE